MAYYVIDGNKCLFEGMTKEQILSAITQAVETHEISDVDTGFVTMLKEANKNKSLSVWVGTTAEYNALTEKTEDCVYFLTDDTELEDLENAIAQLTAQISQIASLKGTVLLNYEVEYDPYDEITVPLQGNLSQFSVVKVSVGTSEATYCEVVCAVELVDTETAYINGVGCGHGGDEDNVTNYSVNLCVNLIDMTIIKQKTVSTYFTSGDVSISTESINKIVGVA